ncbi:ribosomal-protein-serine acetyltransferase [Bacillus pakistanensis]|uniref:Ribosomal-protein-serine acetyltransferase n=1 Tax=Rossellomorea pakistanensis TaxID=992288 RepID=A0ABS2NIR0_9BACI|nr:GNAT family protein [Bacillus pakistanensis]MBM7587720.1 ribosomal-protein-serine acetyltransferase [Bacillus pakistanensis]
MMIREMNNDITLRSFTVDDSEELFQLTDRSREYLGKWLPWIDYTKEVNDTKEWIQASLKGVVETGGYIKTAAIIYKGSIAGTIGFNIIDQTNKSGVIGYWIGEDFQGKGIMTQACKALIDYGFRELDLNRVEINVATGNLKSKAIPERLGMTLEGTKRQVEKIGGKFHDHFVYSILADEWQK